eukprot:g46580.t1
MNWPGQARLSNSNSVHSSDDECIEDGGDLLDSSGHRPLLMDSEEDEETGKGRNAVEGRPGPVRSGGTALPEAPAKERSEGSTTEADVFSAAPFGSPRSCDVGQGTADVFTKAPFKAKISTARNQTEEIDVFTRAPFSKKKTLATLQETVPYPPVSKAGEEMPEHTQFSGTPQDGLQVGQGRFPGFEEPCAGSSGGVQHPAGAFKASSQQESRDVPAAHRATEPLKNSTDFANHQKHPLPGTLLGQEGLLAAVTPQPFRPRALAKYSRHYKVEDERQNQPVAPDKMQGVRGADNPASLHLRTSQALIVTEKTTTFYLAEAVKPQANSTLCLSYGFQTSMVQPGLKTVDEEHQMGR